MFRLTLSFVPLAILGVGFWFCLFYLQYNLWPIYFTFMAPAWLEVPREGSQIGWTRWPSRLTLGRCRHAIFWRVFVKIDNCICPNTKKFLTWLHTLAIKLDSLQGLHLNAPDVALLFSEEIFFKTVYSCLIYFTTILIFAKFSSHVE